MNKAKQNAGRQADGNDEDGLNVPPSRRQARAMRRQMLRGVFFPRRRFNDCCLHEAAHVIVGQTYGHTHKGWSIKVKKMGSYAFAGSTNNEITLAGVTKQSLRRSPAELSSLDENELPRLLALPLAGYAFEAINGVPMVQAFAYSSDDMVSYLTVKHAYTDAHKDSWDHADGEIFKTSFLYAVTALLLNAKAFNRLAKTCERNNGQLSSFKCHLPALSKPIIASMYVASDEDAVMTAMYGMAKTVVHDIDDYLVDSDDLIGKLVVVAKS